MVLGEVVGLEAHAIHQRHGQGVAQGQLEGGACGGCEVKSAGFFRHADVEHDIRGFAQGRIGPCRHGHEGTSTGGKSGQQAHHFVAASAFGQAKDGVVFPDCSDISVQGFTCVEEPCTGAGGIEGG